MKKLILFLILFTTIVFAQSKDNSVIKVYLEDAENGKNIADAKVTLEGFEIPAITGKYNKKGKFYYFDSIPKGYNTVMAYHKKYNEKGFQNIDSLPKVVKLKLYDPLNVTYDFLEYDEDIKVDREKYFYNNKNQFVDIFVEDPYKLIIHSKIKSKYEENRDTLLSVLKQYNLKLRLINPYTKKYDLEGYPNCKVLTKPYSTFELSVNDSLSLCNCLPDISNREFGTSLSYDDNTGAKFTELPTSTNIVFIFEKENGEKFKRYNDPIIKTLLQIENINLYGVIYLKARYRGEEFYKRKSFKWVDNAEKKYWHKKSWFLYTQFFSLKFFFSNNNNLKKYYKKEGCPYCNYYTSYTSILFNDPQIFGLGILDTKQREDLNIRF